MPSAPPSPDPKVKASTQERHATQRGEDCSMDASMEENGARRRRRHWPKRDKAFVVAP